MNKLNQVVILSGGLGTRLYPITKIIPKSLVDICGKPFLYHQLEYLRLQGIESVVICLGHMGEMVSEFLRNYDSHQMKISCSFDGESQLGTGGAIRKCLNLLEDNFYIIYGDSFLPINFQMLNKFFFDNRKNPVMSILKNDGKFDISNVEKTSAYFIYYNKKKPLKNMSYIDYGLSILPKKLFYQYEEGACFDLADLMHKLSTHNQLMGYEVFDRFYEIGSHEGLAETRDFFLKTKP